MGQERCQLKATKARDDILEKIENRACQLLRAEWQALTAKEDKLQWQLSERYRNQILPANHRSI